jgi:hypothetical protein
MRNVSLSAAFILAIALAGLTPAKAEMNGPVKTDDGQCKQSAANNHNGNFYFMVPCPKPAATANATGAIPARATVVVRRHRHPG